MDTSDHPPRPRLAYRVGIIGHRPNRLSSADLPALQRRIADVLSTVAQQLIASAAANASCYFPEKPLLSLLTSLAEGSDRLFAQAALDDPRIAQLPLDLRFTCPFPFLREEYQRDFAPPHALEPDSLPRFLHLLDAITQRTAAPDLFELDGSRDNAPAAYAAAGRIIVNHCDLLLVVWDGRHQGLAGGTDDMIAFAASAALPVVWIDAHAPHHLTLLPPSFTPPHALPGHRLTPPDSDITLQLQRTVASLLDLPTPAPAPPDQHEHAPDRSITYADFLAEHTPRFRFPFLWSTFRRLVGGKIPAPPGLPPPPASDQSPALARSAARFSPLFSWPDRLAVYYADVYRSAFVTYYLLASAAVGLALLPLVFAWEDWRTPLAGAAELLTILTILAIVFRGRARRWHERWIDYRFAAELIRQTRISLSLGAGRPFPRLPAHLATYGHPASTWMVWYVHAHERALGLPPARLDAAHLHASLDQLQSLLHDQVAYHSVNARRCRRIDHRLHTAGIFLLALTLLACALHLAADFFHPLESLQPRLLAFLCGFLPAFGAALVGIANQGEFRRIAKRSLSMNQQLSQLLDRLQSLRAARDPPRSTDAAALAALAARLMVNETLDWRVVVLDRPLELHA